jgi:uncharacterized repeat protein (TIGR01451 family)
MMLRSSARLGVLSVVAFLFGASAADGAVTIGQTSGATNSCASGQVLLQASTAGAPSYAAPSGGVVVQWKYGATGGNPDITFKVYHSTASPTTWFLRSKSAVKTPGTGPDQIKPNMVNTFNEVPGLPIQTGDVLGLTGNGGSGISCIDNTGSMSDRLRVKAPPEPPPGSDSGGFNGELTMQKLAVSAVIEPDADGDLYGDETQDSCPTDASVHTGGCPVDVEIVKTASAEPKVGSNMTYTLAVKNNAAANPAANVNVTDVLPSGLTFVSSSAEQGSCAGTTTVTCALGTLGPGQSTSVSIVVQPTTEGPVTNTAGVTTSAQDTGNANDNSTVTTTVAPVVIPPPPIPVLSDLTLTPRSFLAARGTDVTYSVTQAATTTLTVHRRARGVRKGKRCVKPPRKPPRRKPKRCTRLVRQGTITHQDPAGPVSFHFSGRLRGKALKPGSYRVSAVARNFSGASPAVRAGFTVKKPARRR